MTMAEFVAELFDDDGTVFKTEDGRTLDEVAIANGAMMECAEVRMKPKSAWEMEQIVHRVPCSEATTRTVYRYLFDDGSAIVVSGGAWDIEGEKPFTWAGA